MKARSFMWLVHLLLLAGVFCGCENDGGEAVSESTQKPKPSKPVKDPPPTPVNDGVTIQPGVVRVKKGASQLFTATVTVGRAEDLRWTILPLSSSGEGTRINPTTGLLTVDENETAKELTIIATATLSGTSYIGLAFVLVMGNETPPKLDDPSQPNDITVSPLLTMLAPGDTESFTAELQNNGGSDVAGDITGSVMWDVDSEDGSRFEENLLTVAQGETTETLVVSASQGSHSGNAFVTVFGNEENPIPVNSGVRVSPQIAAVVKGTTIKLSAYNDTVASISVAVSRIKNEHLTWQVFGGVSGTGISNSALTVAENESAKHLIVRAKTADGSYGTAVIRVIGNGYPEERIKILVDPPAAVLGPGETQTYKVSFSDGFEPIGVTWSVDGNSTFVDNVLTVAADEMAETLTVKANLGQSLAGEDVFGAATVMVLGNENNPLPLNNGVWLSPDRSAVVKGKPIEFSAYSNSGKTEDSKITDDLTWQVFGGVSETMFSKIGLLTVAADESAKHLIVRAKITDGSYGTAVVWVIGNGYPEKESSIAVSPQTVFLVPGWRQTFNVSFSADVLALYGVEWSVNSENGSHFNENVLMVAEEETAETLTVTADLGSDLSVTAKVQLGPLMVQVPGGSFERNVNETNYTVTVSSFLISRYEVTQKQWSDRMGGNPSEYKGDYHPVEKVTWYDAVRYCNMLSVHERLEKVYKIDNQEPPIVTADFGVNGYRLPTEAEWEYAARGGENYSYAGSDDKDAVGWFTGLRGGTRPVGGKPANGYGLYDMTGNVREWCWDWFADYDGRDEFDPIGPEKPEDLWMGNTGKITRGGCWDRGLASDTVSSRCADSPVTSTNTIGFRVVRRSSAN